MNHEFSLTKITDITVFEFDDLLAENEKSPLYKVVWTSEKRFQQWRVQCWSLDVKITREEGTEVWKRINTDIITSSYPTFRESEKIVKNFLK